LLDVQKARACAKARWELSMFAKLAIRRVLQCAISSDQRGGRQKTTKDKKKKAN
jgi:hypothetical protein